MGGAMSVFTFPGIPSREEASLRIFVVLIIQSFSQAETENLEIGVGVAHGDTFCLVGLHGIQYHGCLACPLYEVEVDKKCREKDQEGRPCIQRLKSNGRPRLHG